MGLTKTAPASMQELAERYGQAWNDHDLDAILALQTPDSECRLHGAGGEQVSQGIEACRELYSFLLQAAPDQHFDVQRLVVSGDVYFAESRLSLTFALPFQIGSETFAPTGRRSTFDALDLMQCEGNLINAKTTWIDGVALREQFGDS